MEQGQHMLNPTQAREPKRIIVVTRRLGTYTRFVPEYVPQRPPIGFAPTNPHVRQAG
jgi:hypothetical protein